MAVAGPRLWNTAVEWTQLDELRPIEAFKQAGDAACAAAGWTMDRAHEAGRWTADIAAPAAADAAAQAAEAACSAACTAGGAAADAWTAIAEGAADIFGRMRGQGAPSPAAR